MDYVFGAYRLNTERYELTHAGVPVPLRPKVFQVLAYLLAHPERVVRKEELLAQVWPGQFIGDVGLNRYMMEIRKALGDRHPPYQFLRTVRGHGYRVVADVTREDQTPPARTALVAPARASTLPVGGEPAGPAARRPTIVGREAELAQLGHWWVRAQDGERHLVFVTGEPGIGKTALVEAFLARQAGTAPLWIGRGQCVEQFGAGEPYRPVLEALSRLGRGPHGQQVVALLAQQAPTWLVQLPGLLEAADLEALQRRLAGVTRERMLREFAEALEGLTAQQSLVLVLEDLHWSDPSTLDLLAVLARRREPARLLLLGTYRPPAGQRRAHPLQAVTQELALHGLSVALPVTLLTEDAIAAYLTRRVPGLPHVDALARLVHQHTEGNPLFMVTLLDAWLSQGVLREQDGAWALRAGIEELRDRVPDSLRQMIDGQLDRLSAAEQRVLEAASVAGAEFAAAAVAAGLGQTVEQVDEACAALARRGQWLRAVGEQRWPDGTVAGGYSFSHALYQQVLYGRVAAARRVRLHQRIGVRAERGYGAAAGARAAELAGHFVRGRDYARAVEYLRQAGENALQRLSHQEALTHLTQGLDLLPWLPDTPARTEQELRLHVARSVPLVMTQGYGAPEVEQTFQRARALCQEISETPQVFPVLLGLTKFYVARAEYQIASELEEQLLRLAQHAHDPVLGLQVHEMLGTTLCFRGEFILARSHLEQSLALYDPQQCRALVFLHGDDPGVVCLAFLAWVLWYLGYPDQALHRSEDALRLAQELAHPMNLWWAFYWAAVLHKLRGERHAAQARAEAVMTLVNEQGFAGFAGYGSVVRGWALATQGQCEEGLIQLRHGVTAVQATGQKVGVSHLLALLAEAYGTAGRVEAGLDALAEALQMVHDTGEGFFEAELFRLKGDLLLVQASTRPQGQDTRPLLAEVESSFQHALAVARRQQAKGWELRAATSLARLWQQQGKRAEAHELLAPVYDWFTEGFDTTDLQEAKALLEAWT